MGVLRGHPLACPPSWGGICTRLVDSLPCHKHTLGLGVKTDCCDDQVIWKQEDENAKVISPRPSGRGGGPEGRDTGGPMNPASSTKACAWREPGASRVRNTESGRPLPGPLREACCRPSAPQAGSASPVSQGRRQRSAATHTQDWTGCVVGEARSC